MWVYAFQPSFGFIPEVGWTQKVQTLLSQPPPWSAHAMMLFTIGLIILLLFFQWRASRRVAKRMRRNAMVEFIRFKMLGQKRKDFVKALAEYAITDHFEDAYHDGIITYAEKCEAYQLLAEGKPKLDGLLPRKTGTLSWKARNELFSYLKSLKAAREKGTPKPLPLPEPKKVTVRGNGKLAAMAIKTLK